MATVQPAGETEADQAKDRKTTPHEEEMSLEYPTAGVTTTRVAQDACDISRKAQDEFSHTAISDATVRSTSWSNTRLLPRLLIKERLPKLVQLATPLLYAAADEDSRGGGVQETIKGIKILSRC